MLCCIIQMILLSIQKYLIIIRNNIDSADRSTGGMFPRIFYCGFTRRLVFDSFFDLIEERKGKKE